MDKIPSLRFKEFSGEWEEKKFNEVFSFLQNNTFSREYLTNEKQEVQNIHYGDILVKYNNILNVDDTIPYIKKENDLKKFNDESYLKTGDIIISDTAEDFTVGKAIEIYNSKQNKILSGLHTFPCRTNFEFAFGYLGQYINSEKYHKQLIPLITGIKVSSISKNSIKDTKIKFPCLKEQEKIGNFLSSVDKKISIVEEKLNLFNQYKKGIMQKIFNQELRFKDENGNNYPQWEERKLEDIAFVFIGLVTTMTSNYVNVGVPMIRNSDIFPNKFRKIDELIKLEENFAKKNENRSFKTGDIATIHTGDLGTSAVISEELEGSIGFATLNTRILNNNECYNYYLSHFFNSDKYKCFVNSVKTGDGRDNLNLKDFINSIIPLPCLEEQKKIADFLSAIDDKIENISGNLESLKLFKKSMLQKMFV